QDKIEASEASVFTYLQGVVAIPASFLLLGEKPSWLVALAILVISYGVLRAEQKTHQK
ncbi:TPA: EamA family transporter, partial [Candidatus Collierbacteria bacterium]|nr:EamA family transporter [Candidatus Collierbacteria bacterium]